MASLRSVSSLIWQVDVFQLTFATVEPTHHLHLGFLTVSSWAVPHYSVGLKLNQLHVFVLAVWFHLNYYVSKDPETSWKLHKDYRMLPLQTEYPYNILQANKAGYNWINILFPVAALYAPIFKCCTPTVFLRQPTTWLQIRANCGTAVAVFGFRSGLFCVGWRCYCYLEFCFSHGNVCSHMKFKAHLHIEWSKLFSTFLCS